MPNFISVKQAEDLIREACPLYDTETCPTDRAAGRILREPVHADRDLPPFNRVMMDGIAFASTAWASGKRTFTIEDVARPGEPPKELESAEDGCLEVMTGAVLPIGCDCIAPYEEVETDNGNARVQKAFDAEPMQFVHVAGSDQRADDLLLPEGLRLSAPHIAIAAGVGKATLKVGRAPSIGIVSNGDELVDPGKPITPQQIRPANNYALASVLRREGFDAPGVYHTPDDPEAIRRTLGEALDKHDVLIMSGGVSMGKFDFIPGMLNDLGATVVFHKVAERPGKPFWFGKTAENKLLFALPGNPVSTLVCFHRYVLPQLLRSMGATDTPARYVRLAHEIEFQPALTFFPPVKLSAEDGTLRAETVRYNNSGHFTALGPSDGFIELEAERSRFEAGEAVRFFAWH
jgi:molybdopterin molybdotransferase